MLLINFTGTEQLTMKEEAELKVVLRRYLTLRCITVQLQDLKPGVLNAGCALESPQELQKLTIPKSLLEEILT